MLEQKLKKKHEFATVFNSGKYFRLESFIIRYLKRENGSNICKARFGIVVSKKVGNAVKRNLAKRRIRCLVRLKDFRKYDRDYVVIAKKNILEKKYENLKLEFTKAFKKIEMLEDE
tara:strand:+ start:55 stop:402 length:348 start_codon:yes stop_codon:yes gene_type:complete